MTLVTLARLSADVAVLARRSRRYVVPLRVLDSVPAGVQRHVARVVVVVPAPASLLA